MLPDVTAELRTGRLYLRFSVDRPVIAEGGTGKDTVYGSLEIGACTSTRVYEKEQWGITYCLLKSGCTRMSTKHIESRNTAYCLLGVG